MEYVVRRAKATPELMGLWDGPAWGEANVALVDKFLKESGDHRPVTEGKVLYDERGIYVMFRVRDRYVICTRTKNQELTSKDSCVEVYLEPSMAEGKVRRATVDRGDMTTPGYLNFEMNCGGTILTYYITDPTRCEPAIFRERVVIPEALIGTMKIFHSMPRRVFPEIKDEVEWVVEYFVPFGYFERYVGRIGDVRGQRWRGNFFKCADESSHPHWASWNRVGPEFNFHVPRYFAPIIFEA